VIDHARVVLFGVSDRPQRLTDLEDELVGRRDAPGDLDDVTRRVASDLDPPSDVQATAAYRRRVAGPLSARLVRAALERARTQTPTQESRP
jgi:carbon-monoxide dehydrogenase medium subunit